MRIYDSDMSCGVGLLCGVGTNPLKTDFNRCMMNEFRHIGEEDGGFSVLLASVPNSWKKSIKFLKKLKFKQTLRPITNPNSGRKIIVLAKHLTRKERMYYNKLAEEEEMKFGAIRRRW